MLSYKIISNEPKNSSKPIPDRKVLKPSDPDFQEKVLQRILKHCSIIKGTRAKIKGSRRFGTIVKINYDHKEVTFDSQGRPLFLEFLPDDQPNILLVGYHQITRKGVK